MITLAIDPSLGGQEIDGEDVSLSVARIIKDNFIGESVIVSGAKANRIAGLASRDISIALHHGNRRWHWGALIATLKKESPGKSKKLSRLIAARLSSTFSKPTTTLSRGLGAYRAFESCPDIIVIYSQLVSTKEDVDSEAMTIVKCLNEFVN